jgi:hypothetical protein
MTRGIALVLALAALSFRADAGPRPAGRISGRAVDRDGVALRGISIELHGSSRRVETTTGDDGEFTLEGIQPGAARLVASVPGYRRAERSVVVGRDSTASVDLVLDPSSGRASLTVELWQGSFRSGRATVALFGEQNGRVIPLEVPSGRAVFDVAPGVYSLAVVECCGRSPLPPYAVAICLPRLHLEGNRELQLSFSGTPGQLLPVRSDGKFVPVTAAGACLGAFEEGRRAHAYSASAGELVGAVLDETGAFVMDAKVVLRDQGKSVESVAAMSSTGFRLTAEPGRYELRASAPGTEDVREVVELKKGGQTWWFPRMGPRTAR